VKVLALTKYGSLGASSRIRTLQYLPELQASGLEMAVQPLLGDDYLTRRYSGRPIGTGYLLRAYLERIAAMISRQRYDLVWVEYELMPWMPARLDRVLLAGTPYAADYDDAIFHNYDQHRSRLVRSLLGRKIDAVMAGAALVVAGNEYLAGRAHLAGAGRVEIVPSVVDVDRYAVASESSSEPFTIGWMGSPSTAKYLTQIVPALAEVCRGGRGRVVVVGAGDVDLPGVPVERVAWTEEREVADLQRFDVGVMPLPDEPWARGKCGYKLIQYMACGLPVVASPVGVNTTIVEPGNGFLARDHEEWVSALGRLRDDAALRRRLGTAGRSKVENEYSLGVAAPRLVALLKSVAGREPARSEVSAVVRAVDAGR
jgi:glycosyltransferase involved in cell wall biosynthesis